MNLIKSTSTFSFFTLVSRILGYLRDLLIAINLGSGPIADAFFVAFRIPNTFRRLFSEGTFNAAFVPSYSSELNKGKIKANKFVNEGDSIKSGQTLLIIEAMKTMNPIESNLQGKLIKVLVENEQAVEFGQPLMLIE